MPKTYRGNLILNDPNLDRPKPKRTDAIANSKYIFDEPDKPKNQRVLKPRPSTIHDLTRWFRSGGSATDDPLAADNMALNQFGKSKGKSK